MSLVGRNKFDKKDSLELGNTAQARFKSLALKRGWNIVEATKEQDIDEHWDYLISKTNEHYKVDVKAQKRISRQDETTQDDWVWIELHGVRENDLGWLFGSKADLIAFETNDTFTIIQRSILQKIADNHVSKTEKASSPEEAKYKIYSRKGRPDVISLVEMSLIQEQSFEIWQKE
jgi:hypothetical protein